MDSPTWFSLALARSKLEADGSPFAELWRHGELSLEIYAPRGRDLQSPHARDELYVIVAGQGLFVNGRHRHPFQAGDVLFVPAGTPHRFEQFSEDFTTWVIFFGDEKP